VIDSIERVLALEPELLLGKKIADAILHNFKY
jgi:hypothetical protein